MIESTHYQFPVVDAGAHMAISWHVQGVATCQSLNVVKIDQVTIADGLQVLRGAASTHQKLM